MIRYLRHKEIDFKKWDACVDAAVNSLPYCYSWYLDIACEENWDALVEDDYEVVFPLPFKNRILFKQIYQPFFIQQLGLFFRNSDQHKLLNYFIEQIPSQFRKITLQLNTDNHLQSTFLKTKEKITHHISLDQSYENIATAYNSNIKRHLKKGQTNQLQVVNHISPKELTEMRKKYLGPELKGVQDENDFLRLERLMEKAIAMHVGLITGVSDKTGQLLSAVFYLTGKRSIIYLNAISTPEGKELNAMSFLIDNLLRKYAGSGLIFDFEGSMIPGIARFYKGFGAEEIKYAVVMK